MGSRSFLLQEVSYIKPTNHLMPSGIIQRQKIYSSKACLEATGIRHLWLGDDSPALEKKTIGEIIPSIQMNLGIEPSNVPLNTLLLCTHGIKAAARADTGHVYSSVKVSCAKKHKCFAPCLALGSVAPSQPMGLLWRLCLAARYHVGYMWAPVVPHVVGSMLPLCLRLHSQLAA